jgi:hypothetical protein
MEQQEPRTSEAHETTSSVGEDQAQATISEQVPEEREPLGSFQSLRALLDRARRNQKPVSSRRELGLDKSKSLFVVAGAGVALLLIFFGVFSSPKSRFPLPGESARGAPSLGRKLTPGQEQNGAAKAVTPILNADVRSGDVGPGSPVTPEEVGGTSSRFSATPEKPAPGRVKNAGEYALKNVDFSDPAVAHGPATPNPPPLPVGESNADLKKPSIVFVRSAQNATPALQSPRSEDNTLSPKSCQASSVVQGAR